MSGLEENEYLTHTQYEQLLKPINGARVGKDGKGFSHLEAYDVRAHLNRIFGFVRWSAITESCELIFESETEKDGQRGKYSVWTVGYKAKVRLVISSPCGWELAEYSEYAAGDAQNQPSRADAHDLAMKTAESQALKRCAVNLGDQFGLSLYNDGSLKGVVMGTMVKPNGLEKPAPEPAVRPEGINPKYGEEVPLPGVGPGAEG